MKKIVLYNTGIDTILKNGMNALEKVEYVFKIFKTHKNVVLWWRPHPLLEDTIRKMRPDLLAKYMELMEYFKNNLKGIYDDTPDLHRAIAMSDAYYGDWSSLIWLYKATGKPILINNPAIMKDDIPNIEVYDFVEANNKLWFTAYNFNALFSFDLDTNEIIFQGQIPGEKILQSFISYTLEHVDKYLVIVPGKAHNVIIYDLDESCFKEPVWKNRCLGFQNLTRAFSHKNTIYMMDTPKRKLIKFMSSDFRVLDSRMNQNTGNFTSGRRFFVVKEQVYFCSDINQVLYQLDLASGACTSYLIGESHNIYKGLQEYNEKLVLACSSEIVIWDTDKHMTVGNIKLPKEFCGGEAPFADLVRIGGYIYIYPYHGNMIIKINLIEKTSEIIKDYSNNDSTQKVIYHCAKEVNNKIYAISDINKCIEIFDPVTGIQTNIPLIINGELDYNIKKEHLFSYTGNLEPKAAFYEVENDFVTIDKYVNDIQCNYVFDKEHLVIDNQFFINGDGTCGEKIWKYIKEKIK